MVVRPGLVAVREKAAQKAARLGALEIFGDAHIDSGWAVSRDWRVGLSAESGVMWN